MKEKQIRKARALRKKGWSLRAIASCINSPKSSVSRWIAGIVLTNEQIKKLKSNQDKGRALAARHPNSSRIKWENIRNGIKVEARKDIAKIYTKDLLRLVGTALYWAEGYNASRNTIIFANTDPRMIQLIMLYFRQICGVPEYKFRGKISIHPHLDVKRAERYWSEISKIPLNQFNKALLAVSRSSKGKRDTLPMGTFRIIVNDVYFCSKIKGWIDGLKYWGG